MIWPSHQIATTATAYLRIGELTQEALDPVDAWHRVIVNKSNEWGMHCGETCRQCSGLTRLIDYDDRRDQRQAPSEVAIRRTVIDSYYDDSAKSMLALGGKAT